MRIKKRWSVISLGVSLALFPFPVSAQPVSPPDIDRQIDQQAAQLTVVIEKYDTARVHLTTTQSKTAQLVTRLDPLRARVTQLDEEVGKIARAVYQGGSLGTLNALVNAKSAEELTNRLALVNHLAYMKQQHVNDLRQAKAELEAEKRALDAALEQQTHDERALATSKADIERQLTTLTMTRWGGTNRSSRSGTRDAYVPPFRSGPSGSALQFAYKQIGTPYIFGAEGPNSYDCSGLTLAAWRRSGVELPHSVALQRQVTAQVSQDDLRPGDLIFYFDDLHHVGMYAGAGRMIHAPQPGQQITMAPMDSMPIHSFGRPRM